MATPRSSRTARRQSRAALRRGPDDREVGRRTERETAVERAAQAVDTVAPCCRFSSFRARCSRCRTQTGQRLMTISDIRSARTLAKPQKSLRAVNPARRRRIVEDAHLGEQSGLIPIEMRVGDFASLELDDAG